LAVVFVADQVYGDEDMHSAVRQLCVDYMVCVTLSKFNIYYVSVADKWDLDWLFGL